MEDGILLGVFLALILIVAGFVLNVAGHFTESSMANSNEPVLTSVKAFFWVLVAAAPVAPFLAYWGPKEDRLSVVIGVALAFVLMEWVALRRGRRIRREIDYYAGCLRSEQPVDNRRMGARGLGVRAWAARRARPALIAASEQDADDAVRWLARDALDRVAYGYDGGILGPELVGKDSIESRVAEIRRFLRKYLPMALVFCGFLLIWVLAIVKFGVWAFMLGPFVPIALAIPVLAVWAMINKLRHRDRPAQTPPKAT